MRSVMLLLALAVVTSCGSASMPDGGSNSGFKDELKTLVTSATLTLE